MGCFMSFLHGDTPPDRPPAEGWERWTATIVGGLFLGLMGGEILRDFEPAKLSAVFIPLFWMPLVALHEVGHALVAKWCGWKVERLVVGYGKPVKWFKVGQTSVVIRQFPIEGYVLPRPTNLRSPRLKQTLIYAAGPGIEILFVLLIYAAVGGDVLLAQSENVGIIAAQSLCVSALLGVFLNLLPHWTTTSAGRSWSDGMGMLMSWRLPDEYFEKLVRE